MLVYTFGIEEHTGEGVDYIQSNKYFYSLAEYSC